MVILYAYRNNRGMIPLSMQEILDYLEVKYSATHWKEAAWTRILNAGYRWLLENGLVDIYDGKAISLYDCSLNERFTLMPEAQLFNIAGDKDGDDGTFEPYFQLYQNDIEKIFTYKSKSLYKLFRVYCYVKCCLPNRAPYAWSVTVREIVGNTGYTPVYVSKALSVLCDEIGVLHRAALNRTSQSYPPYVYIADTTGWEKHLKQKVAEMNDERGGIPMKTTAKKTAENSGSKSELSPGSQSVSPDLILDGDWNSILSQPLHSWEDIIAVSKKIMDLKIFSMVDREEHKRVAQEINRQNGVNKFSESLGLGLPSDFAQKDGVLNILKAKKILNITADNKSAPN